METARTDRSIRPPTPGPFDNKPLYGAHRSVGAAGAREWNEDPLDRAIGSVATRQGGVISTGQVRGLGARRREIGQRLACGRLIPYHRGVYAVGHADVGVRGRRFAALLAAGRGAVLSHRSAAAAWRMLREPDEMDVTVIGRRIRSRPRLAAHFAAALPTAERAQLEGIPVTAPFRTLLDPAAAGHDVHLAVAEAQVQRLLPAEDLELRIAAAAGRPGARRLAAALGSADAAPTRSRLERAFLDIVTSAGLPRPRVNARVGRFECDFAWPDRGLVVEVDGWAAHGHRAAFERDRARDAELQALGHVVVRFTWRQVTEERLRVAARLAALLGTPAP